MESEETRLGGYSHKGYSIEDNGEPSVTILYKGIVIAVFNRPNVTAEEIQDVCRRHKEALTGLNVRV